MRHRHRLDAHHRSMSSAVSFDRLCSLMHLPVPVAEHRFSPPRRWRFDWAWPDQKVALEVQGGLFVQGRHARGAALLKEHEKLNEAAAQGWRVLYVVPGQLDSTATLDCLRRTLA